jgi:uncharacterized protein YqjF (DUF2071 family)
VRSSGKPLMSAYWRHLVMLSYEIDSKILEPLVPAGTVLDTFDGMCFVSLVGFLFEDSRLKGLPIPLYSRFEELNLRFYVKRSVGVETRRAVVFVKELVPKRAVALVAKLVYNEPYSAVPMSHKFEIGEKGQLGSALYQWEFERQRCEIGVEVDSVWSLPESGSIEEFIAEHYWGYTRLSDSKTAEYEVTHPQWRVAHARRAWLDCDREAMYGERFAECLSSDPVSAFLAEGSEVSVHPRTILRRAELK